MLQFYEDLAEIYHLQFEDWNRSIARQAKILDSLLQADGFKGRLRVLDCTCGIGTQSLGLAALGHHVTASDLSAAAVHRASREARARGLDLETVVDDVRSLRNVKHDGFDVVISMDNALPHLPSDQLPTAFHAIAAKLRPGGLFMASMRDYDHLLEERPSIQAPAFFGEPGQRRIVHQVWEWLDKRTYVPHMYITQQEQQGWKTHHAAAVYHCVQRDEITNMLQDAGFCELRWRMPEESLYYQPIVIVRKG